jgi:hypothetical protein
MTTAPTELKSCPLCDHQPLSIDKWIGKHLGWQIFCFHCGSVSVEGLTEAEATAKWNTRAPAVGGVRVKPLVWIERTGHFLGMWSEDQDEYTLVKGVEHYRVYSPGTGSYLGAFNTLEAAKAAAQAHHEAAILSALEPQAVDDAMVERMARAHDKEEAAQRGEPSPWDDPTIDAAWIAERITCIRAALQAAKEPSHG